MSLSTEDTAALVQGMGNCVESVVLGYHGPVELDWDTLLTYNGWGHCRLVKCYGGKTIERYADQLATWGRVWAGTWCGVNMFMFIF